MQNALFGPAGNSQSFSQMGYKSSEHIPEYVSKMGLDAYEYQCGRGVKIGREASEKLGRQALEHGVVLSLHAPYYISLSSVEEIKRRNSVDYILQSARAVSYMGGNRIVVHSGSCAKLTREAALELAMESMGWAIKALDDEGLSNVRICPEVMGKINQLGTLDEVLELCSLDERMLPCVDFGHLNARTFGSLRGPDDYKAVFDAIENRLGVSRLREMHIHFSKIEYTQNGGEKRHLTFEDSLFGPDFEPLIELIAKRGCHPTIICESDGTQAEDAAVMRKLYYELKGCQ